MVMIMLNISPAVMESQTPSISRICGRISTGITIKITVLQNDNMAEVFPSFNAVNQPDPNTLYASIGKLVATMRNPCNAIFCTFSLFFAKKSTTVPPKRRCQIDHRHRDIDCGQGIRIHPSRHKDSIYRGIQIGKYAG